MIELTGSALVAVVIAMALYLILMIAIGIIAGRKTKSADDYFLGGRALSGPVAALSAQASDMSGWVLMGLPGSIYALGTGQVWIAIGLGIGTILNWIIVAKPLRAYSITANNSTTLPEFLSNRFHDNKKVLLRISAIVLIIFFSVYTASAFASGAKLFKNVLKLDYHVALVISVAVILIYTFLGGFIAVCRTDFIQGTLMLIGIMVIPILAYFFIGDFDSALTASGVSDSHTYLNLFYENGEKISAVSIISSLAWGLGYCGMPHVIIRFMAIKSEKEVKKSTKIAVIWIVLCLLFAALIGIVGRAFIPGLDANTQENVFIEMIKKIFVEKLPLAFVGGIFLSGILAAIMSTADSQLIMCSSSVSVDLYKGVHKKDASDGSVLLLGRITTVVVALVALVFAWDPDSSIMALVSDAWAGLGSAFGPLVLMSLFWKRTNFPGAIAGLVSGAATVIIWDYLPIVNGDTIYAATGLYSLVVGFAISLVAIIVVSLLTKAPDEEIVKDFETYKNYTEAE